MGEMFRAFGEQKAIGYHIFGSETCLNEDLETLGDRGVETSHNFMMLQAAAPLIFEYQDKNRIWSAVQEEATQEAVVLDGFDGDWSFNSFFISKSFYF